MHTNYNDRPPLFGKHCELLLCTAKVACSHTYPEAAKWKVNYPT
jgi:hypothetical protein